MCLIFEISVWKNYLFEHIYAADITLTQNAPLKNMKNINIEQTNSVLNEFY